MNVPSLQSAVVEHDAALSLPSREPTSIAAEVDSVPAAAADSRMGKRMIVAGFVITILGVIGYCVASFAAGTDAGMDDVLFRNAEPFARVTLGVLGLGTLVWLIGSWTYLRAEMEADDDLGEAERRPEEPR
jgi:hypothetical protein